MAFVRIKTRKTKELLVEYAYLVDNSWRKRKKMPKQKVKEYLGKIYRFDCSKEEFLVSGLSYSTNLKEFIKFCLLKSGFSEESKKFVKNGITVDLYRLSVYTTKGKKCVVQINDGFICNWSLKELFKFKITSEADGASFAKVLRLCGLNVTPSNFVSLFQLGLIETKTKGS